MKTSVRFSHAQSDGSFWKPYLELMRTEVLPYQWKALNDQVAGAEPSHAIENFRIAAGLVDGPYHGFVFQDSDVGKWIEAASWSLVHHPDPELEARIDQTVELLEKAQAPDGYLNTYFTIKEPGRRWTNLGECHELYSAGHLLEGAVAYFRVKGKRRFLDLMLRYVDLIDRTFGPGEGQLRGYDGHQEIELALLGLYEALGDELHLRLAAFFLEERGRSPSFFRAEWEARGRISHWTQRPGDPPGPEYTQSHQPARKQTVAVGHAVRAVYWYAALAALATHQNDEVLAQRCQTLWESVGTQLYVTGGIGSTANGEAFTTAFDLPNDTAYAETCASVGLVFFAQRLLQRSPNREYADVIEQALYNTILSGVALDGQHFFYANPLEVWPAANRTNPGRHHAKTRRQAWFSCACCPPNLARLVLSLDHYVASMHGTTIFVHHYFAGRLEGALGTGRLVFDVATAYPRDGRVEFTVVEAPERACEVAWRVPAWCERASLSRDGAATATVSEDGYFHVTASWVPGDRVVLDLAMEVQVLEAHPQVRADAGKVCLRRGPTVYCFEEADNGPNLPALQLLPDRGFEPVAVPGLPTATQGLRGWARRRNETGWGKGLYRPLPTSETSDASEVVPVVAVPYRLWGQRAEGEMAVWMRG